MRCCIRRSRRSKSFKARFVGIDGEPVRVANGTDKDGKAQFIANALPDKAAMDEVVAALEKAKWTLASVQATEQQRRPLRAVHHQPAAAGCVEQAGLQCAADDGRGAAACMKAWMWAPRARSA